ncbi:uncharacterized protein LOC116618221 [Nematostella vectensis]|uniref:uncharacterized protein LOC116618221 n=1 Tax=Nematostella vectensis TaxID=45351 RepID=UPI00207776B4|nr:uncharacterized protein LOC116618221 [Nematostella vectensis]
MQKLTVTFLTAALLCSTLVPKPAEGGIVEAFITKIICNKVCDKVCDKMADKPGSCKTVCKEVGCTLVTIAVSAGKRDEIPSGVKADQEMLSDALKDFKKSDHLSFLILPNEFAEYDTNHNSVISYDEFKKALGMGDESAKWLFDAMDKDGDKAITCYEFLLGATNSKIPFKALPKCL